MISCIILSGGLSRRFRDNTQRVSDKALYMIDGAPMIIHVLNKLSNICDYKNIMISVRDSSQKNLYKKYLREYSEKILLLEDLLKNYGPLGGLYTTLRESRSDYVIVVPNDMPFIDKGMLKDLLRIAESQLYDIVSPMLSNTMIESLVIVSKTDVLKRYINLLIKYERKRALDLHRAASSLYLFNTESHGYNYVSLKNINYEKDLYINKIPRKIVDNDVYISRGFDLNDIERDGLDQARGSLWSTLKKSSYCDELDLYLERRLIHLAIHVLREDPLIKRSLEEAYDLIDKIFWI